MSSPNELIRTWIIFQLLLPLCSSSEGRDESICRWRATLPSLNGLKFWFRVQFLVCVLGPKGCIWEGVIVDLLTLFLGCWGNERRVTRMISVPLNFGFFLCFLLVIGIINNVNILAVDILGFWQLWINNYCQSICLTDVSPILLVHKVVKQDASYGFQQIV